MHCQINNTLQVILATDGTRTVSIFHYEDIQWGEEAQIGFNVGDGRTSFTLPEALSYLALNVDEYSNVGEPGVFIFRIDSKSNAKISRYALNFCCTIKYTYLY